MLFSQGGRTVLVLVLTRSHVAGHQDKKRKALATHGMCGLWQKKGPFPVEC